jgi:hypothetical protein
LVAVLWVVGLLFLGLFVYLVPTPEGNCTDWYLFCPGGPSAYTPLGTAPEFGNASSMIVSAGGAAQAGRRTPEVGKEYCESIAMGATSSGLATNSIRFQLLDRGGMDIPYISVTLTDADGKGIASITPGGSWALCTPTLCGVATSMVTTSLPAYLSVSERFVPDGGPSATVPNGLTPYGLEAIGIGSFDGTVGPVTLA